jgi:hypothetical protein
MSHEEAGDAAGNVALAERRKALLKLATSNGVERAERLVEKEQPRTGRKCARDCDALPLTARELARPSVAKDSRIESHESERNVAPFASLVVLAAQAKDELDVAAHAPMREQASILRYVADLTAQFDEIRRGDVARTDHDAPGVGGDEAVEAAEECRLSGTARADEGDAVSFLDVEAHSIERDDATESLDYRVRGERRRYD